MTGRTIRVLAVGLASLLALASVQAPPAAADQVVTIPDVGLRVCLRNELNLNNGEDLTETRLAGIKSLWCRRTGWTPDPIKDLTGIEYLTGVAAIGLWNEPLTDLSPLTTLTHLTSLDLYNCGVTDASTLAALPGLTSLSLSYDPITDLGFLASLGSLERLQVWHVPADPAPISAVPSLTYLSLGENGTSNYAFLTNLPHLTELVITDDTATTLGPLGRSSTVTRLRLQCGELTDLSAIAGLTGLKELSLSGSKVAGLEPLTGLTNLSSLIVGSSAISDLRPISSLSSLQTLSVENSQITDLSPLSGLNLSYLGVRGNKVSSLPDFSGMWLGGLDLSDNQLSSLRIDGYGLLTGLNVSGNQLTSVHLANLGNLRSLAIDGNAFTSLSLSDLPVLASVDASSNKLTTPGSYSNLPRLSTLVLRGNQLTTLSGLGDVPALADLDASDNQLTTLAPLAGLSLSRLNVSGNQLASLVPVAGLPLTQLNASRNKLTELPAFTHAAGLTELDAAHNLLKVSSQLRGLPALASVDLSHNLLTDASPLNTLPSLTTLLVSGNAIADLAAFTGNNARIQADAQTIAVPENAPIGTPVPITLRGPNGKIPDLTPDAGVTVTGGTVTYTTAGQHTIGFSQSVGTSVFSGKLTRVAGSNAVFTSVAKARLTGSPSVGAPMGAVVKAWTPVVDHYGYQWYLDGLPILDATDQHYTPRAKDLGHRLKASVTGVKDGYLTVTTWTPTSAKVVRGTFKVKTPVIVGATRTGSQLTVSTGEWSPKADRYTYQWFRNGHSIARANKVGYVLTAADLGKRISVAAKGRAKAVKTRLATSKRTRAVTEGPVFSAQPEFTGLFIQGTVLGVDPGTWGPGKITFTYQWLWDGRPIPKATAKTYLFSWADSGHRLSVAVTGDRASYTPVTRVSRSLDVP